MNVLDFRLFSVMSNWIILFNSIKIPEPACVHQSEGDEGHAEILQPDQDLPCQGQAQLQGIEQISYIKL